MEYFLPKFRKEMTAKAAEILGVDDRTIAVDDAADGFDADLAIPCFSLAKELKRSPDEIAKKLAVGLEGTKELSKIETVGGYVNLSLKPESLIGDLASENYGQTDDGKGKTVIVDFIGLNLAKPFSVGHLRPTMQGWALIQIYKALGYEVVGDSHMGDWGTPFGMWVAGFEKWSSDEQLDKDGAYELGRIYIKFREEAAKDESLIDEAKAWLKKLEDGDKKARAYHEKFNKISFDHASQLLDELGVRADENLGESFYIEKSQELVNELVVSGVAEQQADDSVVVHLESYGLEVPVLLRKSDGSVLYATSDIETIRYRLERWSPAKIIYSVGSEQQFHFKQVFALADKLGYTKDTDVFHAWFGMIDEILDSGKRTKMSSRKSTALLKNLLKVADKEARAHVEVKLSDEDFKIISVGAIKFNDFARPRQTNILFDWDSIFSLQGHSSVYIQYAAVRVGSILEELKPVDSIDGIKYNFTAEKELLMQLARYPEAIKAAAEGYEPYRIADYVYELAKAWNRYYEKTKVRGSADSELAARTWLLQILQKNFVHALDLLGIQVPSKM